MADEKLLTIRDVSLLLGISEKEVIDLSESGAIPAYKIGGVYLRFKRQQIEEYRRRSRPLTKKSGESQMYLLKDRVRDFLYFNDFYIVSALLITAILFVIFRGF